MLRQILAPDFVRHCQATPDVVVQTADQFIDYLKADAASSRTRAGRLAELWVTWDNLAALAQLGHFPPPQATPKKGAA